MPLVILAAATPDAQVVVGDIILVAEPAFECLPLVTTQRVQLSSPNHVVDQVGHRISDGCVSLSYSCHARRSLLLFLCSSTASALASVAPCVALLLAHGIGPALLAQSTCRRNLVLDSIGACLAVNAGAPVRLLDGGD